MNEHTISAKRLKELEAAEALLKTFKEKLAVHVLSPNSDLISVGELTLSFFGVHH